MKKKLLLLTVLTVVVANVFAQTNSYIGVKLDGYTVGGYSKSENIRISSSNTNNGEFRAKAALDVFNVNVTYVKFTNNKRFGFSGGLRYSGVKARTKNNEVYMLHDGVCTNYYGVKEIANIVNFIGIPIGVEFVVTNPEAVVRMYFNVGCNFDFKVASSYSVTFDKNTSTEYVEKIGKSLDQPASFCFSTIVGVGMHIGRPNKVNGTIEIDVPYYGYNAVGIVSGRLGGGLSLGIDIPLK